MTFVAMPRSQGSGGPPAATYRTKVRLEKHAERCKDQDSADLGRGKLELKKTVESGQVRQSFSHGRSKVVQVERKRKRQFEMGADGKVQEVKTAPVGFRARADEAMAREIGQHGSLTEDEKAHRLKALQE